jgi:hypothetical protein
MRRIPSRWVVGAALVALAGPARADDAPGKVPATPPVDTAGATAMDPRAVDLLKKMSDYLTGLPAFTVHAETTQEVVLTNGEKLQFGSASDLFVQRPNRLRSNRVGDVTDVEFYYDGSAVTLYGKKANYYASRPAPATIDAVLDEIRERLGIEPPAADLLYSDVYDGLMDGVSGALYVAPAMVGGAKAHHLAFRAQGVDWQIWIQDGKRPLPLKYLITSSADPGSPEFGVSLSNWNVAPQLKPAIFAFTPPSGATKIEFLETAAAPAPEGK